MDNVTGVNPLVPTHPLFSCRGPGCSLMPLPRTAPFESGQYFRAALDVFRSYCHGLRPGTEFCLCEL